MKRKKFLIIFCLIVLFSQSFNMANAASVTVSGILPKGTSSDTTGDSGLSTGAVVGIATSAGGAAAGAGAFAFAPLLLVGLQPNSVICAAAPIDGIQSVEPTEKYLQAAIKNQGGHLGSSHDKFHFAQKDCDIINGRFDIDNVTLPKNFESASKIKVNITIASQEYNEIDGDPEFALGIYKDISRVNLNKKFETHQFLHHYLMKKYDIPLKITQKEYANGIQKLTGIIDMSQIKNKQLPLQVVVRYSEGGFSKRSSTQNLKILRYAYLIEFEKI